MLGDSRVALFIGFGIACFGFTALGYVNFCVRKSLWNWSWRPIKHLEYTERKPRRLLLYAAAICIFAGIVTMFCAIVYSNQMKLR